MNNIISAYIEITSACNEHCPYCYNKKLMHSGKNLSEEVLNNLFYELKNEGLHRVTLSGGEPFLHKSIDKLMHSAKELEISLTIISNGTCFDDNHFSSVLKYQPNLQLSFDGYNDSTHDRTRGIGNFRKLTEGIKQSRAEGYNGSFIIRVNLHKKNIGHVQEFLDTFDWLLNRETFTISERDTISLSLLKDVSSDDSNCFTEYLEAEEYLAYPEIAVLCSDWNKQHKVKIDYDFDNPDVGCPYNTDSGNVSCGLRIALDGNVYPCQSFVDEQFSLGNVYTDSLVHIINSQRMDEFVRSVRNRLSFVEKCHTCGYQAICARGCPATAFLENGTINSVSNKCQSRKAYFNKALIQVLHEQMLASGEINHSQVG